jgi:predicted DNA-binding ribbon-helix-helix protein
MSQPEFPTELHIRPRPTTSVTLAIPTDTWQSLEQVAAVRDMSVEALLKLYIGQGLRHDVAQRFADRVLDLTVQVLARHGQSQEQVAAIVREIRDATGS